MVPRPRNRIVDNADSSSVDDKNHSLPKHSRNNSTTKSKLQIDDAENTSRRRRWRKEKSKTSCLSLQHNKAIATVTPLCSSAATPLWIHPTISLPILVLIDMFAVSLVVPLLFQYYKAAGVTSANQRELLSSLFSSSQIAGGLLMGLLLDAKIVQRRTILFVSFAGSALSYGMISYSSSNNNNNNNSSLTLLIASRVLVGFVKQTMTIATTILTRCTSKATRAKHMGRLTASSTVAWIVGPSVGALLFKYVSPKAPALVACLLFLCNLVLAVVLLQGKSDKEIEQRHSNDTWDDSEEEEECDDDDEDESEHSTNSEGGDDSREQVSKTKVTAILSNLKACFSSSILGSVIVSRLIYTWVMQATSYSQLGSFYEDMYGLEPHHRGYISSYQQFLQFIVQSSLVATVLKWSGGERRTICFFSALLAIVILLESLQSLPIFLFLVCPLISLCFSMTNLSLSTLLTYVAPSNSIFSVLTSLDVLQNAVSVSVPFYRTFLFQFLASDSKAAMQGDPDPLSWIYTGVIHWMLAAVAMTSMLLSDNEKAWQVEEQPKRKDKK